MKTIKAANMPDGKRRLIIELDAGERFVVVRDDEYYQMGEPLNDDVVQGHHIADCTQVSWCVISQKWVP